MLNVHDERLLWNYLKCLDKETVHKSVYFVYSVVMLRFLDKCSFLGWICYVSLSGCSSIRPCMLTVRHDLCYVTYLSDWGYVRGWRQRHPQSQRRRQRNRKQTANRYPSRPKQVCWKWFNARKLAWWCHLCSRSYIIRVPMGRGCDMNGQSTNANNDRPSKRPDLQRKSVTCPQSP